MKKIFFLLLMIVSGKLFAQFHTMSAPLVEKSIELPGRIHMRYVEHGAENGVPVIFLHGFPDSWHSYEFVLPLLPASIHAYALSQRGHGNSDHPSAGYRPEDFAADLAAFMKKKRIKNAVIVGHSMGGAIAQCFSTRYPELIKGLVLIGSFASLSTKPDIIEFNETIVSKLKDPIDKSIADEFQKSTLARNIPAAFYDTLLSESMKVSAHTWHGVFEGLISSDYIADLKKMRRPVLLIWGDKDVMVPRFDQDILLAAMNGAKLNIYKGAGHSVQWEDPETVAKDIIDFVNQNFW